MNRVIYAGLLIGLTAASTEGFSAGLGAVDPNAVKQAVSDAAKASTLIAALNTALSTLETDLYNVQYSNLEANNTQLNQEITACAAGTGCLNPTVYPQLNTVINAQKQYAMALQYYTKLPDGTQLKTDLTNFQTLVQTLQTEIAAIRLNLGGYTYWVNQAINSFTQAADYKGAK